MAGGEGVEIAHPANRLRHPELVSGPISRLTRSKQWQAQPHRQVRPMRVVHVDQVDLPLPMPALQLLLAQDRRFHLAEQFIVDQAVDSVARGETRQCIVAVLPQSSDEVGGNADVDRAVGLARKDIGAGTALLPHGPELAAKWALKQVQGDDNCWVVC